MPRTAFTAVFVRPAASSFRFMAKASSSSHERGSARACWPVETPLPERLAASTTHGVLWGRKPRFKPGRSDVLVAPADVHDANRHATRSTNRRTSSNCGCFRGRRWSSGLRFVGTASPSFLPRAHLGTPEISSSMSFASVPDCVWSGRSLSVRAPAQTMDDGQAAPLGVRPGLRLGQNPARSGTCPTGPDHFRLKLRFELFDSSPLEFRRRNTAP
jgi:hypothetical protein